MPRRCQAAVRAPRFADAQRALWFGGLWTRSRMANAGDRMSPACPWCPTGPPDTLATKCTIAPGSTMKVKVGTSDGAPSLTTPRSTASPW
eukprot:3261887-Pyramimonas_sp.AAC.1